jgi:hypothetical protein
MTCHVLESGRVKTRIIVPFIPSSDLPRVTLTPNGRNVGHESSRFSRLDTTFRMENSAHRWSYSTVNGTCRASSRETSRHMKSHIPEESKSKYGDERIFHSTYR